MLATYPNQEYILWIMYKWENRMRRFLKKVQRKIEKKRKQTNRMTYLWTQNSQGSIVLMLNGTEGVILKQPYSWYGCT